MGTDKKRAPDKGKHKILEKTIRNAITGKGAHVEATDALAGLDRESAGKKPAGAPHSVFQLLNHIIFWQEWAIQWLEAQKPAIPKHASGSWPGLERAASEKEWKETVKRFADGLEKLNKRSLAEDLFVKQGRYSRLEIIEIITQHNSYHLGQIVVIRQMLGAWPPPQDR